MRPKVEIQGIEELNKNMSALSDSFGKEVASALSAGGQLVRSRAIRSIENQSRGEDVVRYRSGGGEYDHIASVPGDPPNTDTGNLVRSIQVEIRPDGVYVGTNLDYGAYLEFGTRNMHERPWLTPALDNSTAQIRRMVNSAVRSQARG